MQTQAGQTKAKLRAAIPAGRIQPGGGRSRAAGLSWPRSNEQRWVGARQGRAVACSGLLSARGSGVAGERGGVLSSVFLSEQEPEPGPLYSELSPASSKHPRSSRCECFPGASRRRVSSSTEPISCSLSLSRSLSFDVHLQNSSWPLSLPSPFPVLYYMGDPSFSSSWRHLHSWPTAQLLPTREAGPGVFLLQEGPGRKGVFFGSRSLHHEVHPSSGGLTCPIWPLFGDGGLWSQDPALDTSRGD